MFDAAREEVCVFVWIQDSDSLEKVERWPELTIDAASEKTRTTAKDLAEVEDGVDADFAEEESDDGDCV